MENECGVLQNKQQKLLKIPDKVMLIRRHQLSKRMIEQ